MTGRVGVCERECVRGERGCGVSTRSMGVGVCRRESGSVHEGEWCVWVLSVHEGGWECAGRWECA